MSASRPSNRRICSCRESSPSCRKSSVAEPDLDSNSSRSATRSATSLTCGSARPRISTSEMRRAKSLSRFSMSPMGSLAMRPESCSITVRNDCTSLSAAASPFRSSIRRASPPISAFTRAMSACDLAISARDSADCCKLERASEDSDCTWRSSSLNSAAARSGSKPSSTSLGRADDFTSSMRACRSCLPMTP